VADVFFFGTQCMRLLCSRLMSNDGVSGGQFAGDKCRHCGQRLVSGWSEVTDWTSDGDNSVRTIGCLVTSNSRLCR